MPEAFPCKSKACAVQACMSRAASTGLACDAVVEAFEQCCRNARDRKLPGAETACLSLWRRWDRQAAAAAARPASLK
nr:hypothetical protein HK105_005777 [Polyrhizophydium stewartii]